MDDQAQVEAREMLYACMVDAMNRYVNQVLIPEGVIDEAAFHARSTGVGSAICTKKHEIADGIARKWELAMTRTNQK